MNFFDQDNSYENYINNTYPKDISPYLMNQCINDTYFIQNSNENFMRTSEMQNPNLAIALDTIKHSIMDEFEDEMFYTLLLNQAILSEDKEIISAIRDDEMKHNKMLREIYYNLTGIKLPLPTNTNSSKKTPMTYVENLQNAVISETNAAAKYSKILSAMTDSNNYQSILEILIDELRHASKYNLLVTRTMHNIMENKSEEREKDTKFTNISDIESKN